MAGVGDAAKRRFDVVPAPFVVESSLDQFSDEGATLPGAGTPVEFGHEKQHCNDKLLSAAMGDPGQIGDRWVTYAGFWVRVFAAIVDGLILWPFFIAFDYLTFGDPFPPEPEVPTADYVASTVVVILLHWLYSALMESSSRQATLGKMLLRLQVTDLEGNRVSFGRATGRHFTEYLCVLTLNLGYLVNLFSDKRQSLHDKISRTLVLER